MLVFLNLLPHSKHFHIITAIPNVFTRDLTPRGPPAARWRRTPRSSARRCGAPPRSPTTAEPVGVARIEHFSWKAILDFYTCTECGRCSDNCPAHKTGKILSPKHLTLDLRDHLYGREDEFLNRPGGPKGATDDTRTRTRDDHGHGDEHAHGEHGHDHDARRRPRPRRSRAPRARLPGQPDPDPRGRLEADQPRPRRHPPRRALGVHDLPRLRGAVPGDDHLRRQDRRACGATSCMVKGEFPHELAEPVPGAWRSNGNPWNLSRIDRANWADGLGIPTMAEKPDAPVLYWVGCAASYDDRAKKIARATAKLPEAGGRRLRDPRAGGDLHRRPGAARRQRVPLRACSPSRTSRRSTATRSRAA